MDKHKQCLKLTSVGFSGIVWLMNDLTVSDKLAGLMLEVLKLTGTISLLYICAIIFD